ncbi:cobalamin-dependent methionine synthase I [bacterium]|nr:cobalamin-dependent methionine synthase I [bacterium]
MNRPGFTLLDAAHGTRLIARGLDIRSDDPALWVLRHPESIRVLHLADLQAGAQILTTCTFGANRHWLKRFGSADAVAINRRAVEIVRDCIHDVGSHAEIAGCIGPSSLASESAFREQFDALREAGVQRIVIETISADQVSGLSKLLPESPGCPVFATLWNWGDDPVVTARQLADSGLSGWGINCMSDRIEIRNVLAALFAAGLPATILKPSIAPVDEFKEIAIGSLAFGTTCIGGCCGTDHQHLAALRAIRDDPKSAAIEPESL